MTLSEGNKSYNNLWKETFFEIGVELGTEREEDGYIMTNADYYITVGPGGYSGKIYDLSDDNRVVCTFSTKEKMNIEAGIDKTNEWKEVI